MPFQIPEGHVKIISKIRGKIERCKGLNNTKLLGGSKPYCIVKAIKGNSHLVDLFHTPYGDGKNPQWDASWSYDCTKLRSHEEYVGLKFLVYDGDDFLGGADYDISSLASFREVKEELELAGIASVKSAKGQGLRKPRIWVELTIERRFLPMLDPPKEALQKSLLSFVRVKSICGRIVRARGLHGPMGKKSLPMVFVRCYMRSGRIQNIHNTLCNESWTDPHWDDIFEFDFEDEDDQPLMLIFDIFGSAGGPRAPSKIYHAGDHLGSALLSVASVEDEVVFEEGEARQKLPLHSYEQIVEMKIGRDGKQLRMDPWGTSKNTEVRTRNKSNPGDLYHLTVELFAERTEPLPMRHCELLHTSETIERDDLDDPRFKGDRELEDSFNDLEDDGKKVRRLTLWAEERIVTVYGRIQAAIDLVAADVMGTSDPYVVVEALTKSGQHIFVYRSSIVTGDLNPTWDEAFYFKVPPDPDNPRIPIQVSKMLFSIYDSDEGQIGNFYDDDADDFLGRCGVDVSLMRNCDRLCEDIPLLGCKSRPGGFKSHGGYRRYSTLSVEVRVERRVMRLIDVNHELDSNMLLVKRHHESRPMYPPEVKSYKDLSQEPGTFQPLEYDTAGRVLAIRGTTGLLAQSRYRKRAGESKMIEDVGWLKRPDLPQMWKTAPAPANTIEDEAEYEYSESAVVDHRRTYIGALHEDWDRILMDSRANTWDLDNINRLSPMSRTASLPCVNPMNVRFGDLYEQKVFDPFEDSRKPKPELPRFRQDSDNRSLHNLFQKPGTGKVTMRPGRVHPRPACPGGLNCRCGFHHSATQLL